MTQLTHRRLATPLGSLTLYSTPRGLCYLAFAAESPPAWLSDSLIDASSAALAAKQLESYFAGTLQTFTCPLDVPIGPEFSRTAQRALTQIPYARTATYAELAALAGRPSAIRAAGSACASNPLPLIWPCHRVVRSDGRIGNYRGGADAKRWLLEFEARNRPGD